MADNSILSYLPAGWTEEKYSNATEDDCRSLTAEEIQKLMDRTAAEINLHASNQVDSRNNAVSHTISLPPDPEELESLDVSAEELALLTYLPPGWTEETYRTDTGPRYFALTNEERQSLGNRAIAEVRLVGRAKNFVVQKFERVAAGEDPIQIISQNTQEPIRGVILRLMEAEGQ